MKVTIHVDPTEDSPDDVHEMVDRVFAAAPAEAKSKPADKKADKKADKPAAKKEEPAEEPAAPDGPSRDEVRAKLKEYAALEGKEAAIQILKDNGAASIGELDEAKFADVMKACGD
jgi:hypothetical protein